MSMMKKGRKGRSLLSQRITILLCVLLFTAMLMGCSMDSLVSGFSDLLNLSGSSEDEDVVDEAAGEVEQAPVIVHQTEDFKAEQENDETSSEEPIEEMPEEEPEAVYDDVNKRYTIGPSADDGIMLAFGGDICFHDDFSNMMAYRSRENGIFDCITPDLMQEMQGADIFMVNNEFPYSSRGTPTPLKTYTFRSKPENVNILHDMGVDIVSLANNHAYDYGEEALLDTVDILNEAKVPFVGAGKNLEEAMKPAYFITEEQTIAYVSATQIERLPNPDTKEATVSSAGVLRTLDPTAFLTVIEEAEKNSDFVVVYVHWGSENTDVVEASQRDLATKYIEAGADLIIGDHTHCLQGVEYIEGVPVIYSVGNYWFNSKTLDTCLVKVKLGNDSKIQSFQVIPCIQENCQTRMADDVNSLRILNYMQSISFDVSFDVEGYVQQKEP
ncbi:MAG TPA: CapA family protein [Lachnospiraceae bacterium]|nr:CapA family protein [Lachnospiraceae bacterium]